MSCRLGLQFRTTVRMGIGIGVPMRIRWAGAGVADARVHGVQRIRLHPTGHRVGWGGILNTMAMLSMRNHQG